ncbi:hypothetical protein BEK68_05715 [Ralstonia pickettii]|nr:hypothetical protein BEK68_05715 [Ralstonia pickettii]
MSTDSKWSFVTRVRTLDLLMDAAQAGHKWAVDRGITKTYVHTSPKACTYSCATSATRAR